MEHFDLLNSIPGGDALQLLSDTIAKAASSAALAAVRSVLSDKPKKKKTGGVLKFSNRELNSMSDKLKNYFVCKDRLVSYRFHKGVYEVQFRRDGIKLYVAAKDLDTLKARFRYEMEQYLRLPSSAQVTVRSTELFFSAAISNPCARDIAVPAAGGIAVRSLHRLRCAMACPQKADG